MNFVLTSTPHLNGVLTLWSSGDTWGFSFDDSKNQKKSPFETLLRTAFSKRFRETLTTLHLPAAMIETIEKAEEIETHAPSVLLANAALIGSFESLQVAEVTDVEHLELFERARPHIKAIPNRRNIESGVLYGPLVDLSPEMSSWLDDNDGTLVFSDAGIPTRNGFHISVGAWAYYSTKLGLSSGLCEMELPSTTYAEIFAAEAALRSHEGHMLLVVDSHDVFMAVTGETDRSPFLNTAYQEGRLQVLQVRGHSGCIGNELVDQACRRVNADARGLGTKVRAATTRVLRSR